MKKTIGRKTDTLRATISTLKDKSNTPAPLNDVMIDDEARPVEGNDVDVYIDQDPNNILRYSDLLDPSTTNILDQNSSHSISINDLPDMRVSSITNNNKNPKNTENDSMERPRNAKINTLKNITAPTQTIRVSHSSSNLTIDDTTISNNISET